MKNYNINETRELLDSLGFMQDSEDIYKYYGDFTTEATVGIDIMGKAWINVRIKGNRVTIREIFFEPEIVDWKKLIGNLECRAELVFEAIR